MVNRIVNAVLAVAAAVWTRRAGLIEAAGAVCLVVAASMLSIPLAWAVAGVALVLFAASIERDAP